MHVGKLNKSKISLLNIIYLHRTQHTFYAGGRNNGWLHTVWFTQVHETPKQSFRTKRQLLQIHLISQCTGLILESLVATKQCYPVNSLTNHKFGKHLVGPQAATADGGPLGMASRSDRYRHWLCYVSEDGWSVGSRGLAYVPYELLSNSRCTETPNMNTVFTIHKQFFQFEFYSHTIS